MSGQHDVVLQIEAEVQQASKASEEKASKMEYYAVQGRGIGRKVGLDWRVVECVFGLESWCVSLESWFVFGVLSCVCSVCSIVLCIMQLFLYAVHHVSQARGK
jgi:hypothetical protein